MTVRERDYTGFSAHAFGRVLSRVCQGKNMDAIAGRSGMHPRDIRKFTKGTPPYNFIGLGAADRLMNACGESLANYYDELTVIPGSQKADAIRFAEDEYWVKYTEWMTPEELEELVLEIAPEDREKINRRAEDLRRLREQTINEATG